MQRSPDLDSRLCALESKLLGIAHSLCRDHIRAQDLVQDTYLKALASLHLFDGADLVGWLATIMANTWRTQAKRAAREVQDVDGVRAALLRTEANQIDRITLREVGGIMGRMAPDHREALMMIGAHGYAYDDAAALAGVAVGTMKSRVSRARDALAHRMGVA